MKVVPEPGALKAFPAPFLQQQLIERTRDDIGSPLQGNLDSLLNQHEVRRESVLGSLIGGRRSLVDFSSSMESTNLSSDSESYVKLIFPKFNVFSFERKDTIARYLLGTECGEYMFRIQKQYFKLILITWVTCFVVCVYLGRSSDVVSSKTLPIAIISISGTILTAIAIAGMFLYSTTLLKYLLFSFEIHYAIFHWVQFLIIYLYVQNSTTLQYIGICGTFAVIVGIFGDAGNKGQMKYFLISLVVYFIFMISHVSMDERISGIRQVYIHVAINGVEYVTHINKRMSASLLMLFCLSFKICLISWLQPNRFATLQTCKKVLSVSKTQALKMISTYNDNNIGNKNTLMTGLTASFKSSSASSIAPLREKVRGWSGHLRNPNKTDDRKFWRRFISDGSIHPSTADNETKSIDADAKVSISRSASDTMLFSNTGNLKIKVISKQSGSFNGKDSSLNGTNISSVSAVDTVNSNVTERSKNSVVHSVMHTTKPFIYDPQNILLPNTFRTLACPFVSEERAHLLIHLSSLLCLPCIWIACVRLLKDDIISNDLLVDICLCIILGLYAVIVTPFVNKELLFKTFRSFEFAVLEISSTLLMIILYWTELTISHFIGLVFILKVSLALVIVLDASMSRNWIRIGCILSAVGSLVPVLELVIFHIRSDSQEPVKLMFFLSHQDVMYACITNIAFVYIRQLFRSTIYPHDLLFYRSALRVEKIQNSTIRSLKRQTSKLHT